MSNPTFITVTVRNSTSSYLPIIVYYKSGTEYWYTETLSIGQGIQIQVFTGDIFSVLSPIKEPSSQNQLYISASSGIYDVTPRKYYPSYGNNCSSFLVVKANQSGSVDVINHTNYV